MQKKYIITGSPGTGKTTLIKALKKKGFSTISEISRKVIIAQQHEKGNAYPWGDIETYASLVYYKTKKILREQPESIFMDRSLVDTMAYLTFSNKKIPKELLEFPYQKYYHKTVFFAPSWEEIYEIDAQRPQQFIALNGLQEILWSTYEKLGFTCVLLPKADVLSRIDFVLDKIDL